MVNVDTAKFGVNCWPSKVCQGEWLLNEGVLLIKWSSESWFGEAWYQLHFWMGTLESSMFLEANKQAARHSSLSTQQLTPQLAAGNSHCPSTSSVGQWCLMETVEGGFLDPLLVGFLSEPYPYASIKLWRSSIQASNLILNSGNFIYKCCWMN